MILARRSARRSRGGFTLVEVIVAATVLVIGCLGLSGAITSSARLMELNRERGLAHEAARAQLELLENTAFAEVFARFNATAADDPAAGSSPGRNFAVAGLNSVRGDADGLPGEVIFPTVGNLGLQLTEAYADARFRMPGDLNGDGVTKAGAMTGAYTVLPVRVRVRWRGPTGNSTLDLDTVLMDRTR